MKMLLDVRHALPRVRIVCFSIALLVSCAAVHAAEKFAVATAHPLATEVGERVLRSGGNAFDAAVAVTAALGVVEPFSSGIGGGGFYLLHRASDQYEVMIDARETAPLAANESMYINDKGEVDTRSSLDGAKAAGIPGIPAGLIHLSKKFGTKPLAEMLAPAIAFAENGFPVDGRYVGAAAWRAAAMANFPETAQVFLRDGKSPSPGDVIKQPALAKTLRTIAQSGNDGFYRGAIAEEMVRAVRAGGGLWSLDDLQRYRVIERPPSRFEYRGAKITTVQLPSSGGLTLMQALQILEHFDLSALNDVDRTHLIVEALRRGYQDRARYLGDADFVQVPQAKLASREYAKDRAASVSASRATASAELDSSQPAEIKQGDHTTHFSIVDAAGNRVAATLSINAPFGAAMLAGATGVLLNNEMNDFTIAPGASNLYNLTGQSANLVAAGKRPLSSMSPTFVEDSRGVLVLGTPGGSRIISMVLLGILKHLHGSGVDIAGVVAAPRFHHQYMPDRIEYEPVGFKNEWIEALRAKGHTMQEGKRRWGNMQAVFVDRVSGDAVAEGDPRGKSGVLF